MIITVFDSATSGTPGDWLDVSWEQLKTLFEEPEKLEDKKQAKCIIYGKCRENKRGNANVENRTFAVLDFDVEKNEPGLERETLIAELGKLKQVGVSFLWHSTFSSPHVKTGRFKVRVIIPLLFAIPAIEWASFSEALESFFPFQDKSVKNLERVFFMPCVPMYSNPEDYIWEAFDGQRFAVPEDFKKTHPADLTTFNDKRESADVELFGKAANDKAVDALEPKTVRELAKKLSARNNETDKANARRLREMLEGKPFAPRGERHGAIVSLIGLLVSWFPTASNDAVYALLSPTLTLWNAENVASEGKPIKEDADYVSKHADDFRAADAVDKEIKRNEKEQNEKLRLALIAAADKKKIKETGAPPVSEIEPSGLYSGEELSRCMEMCGATTPEQLKERWIAYFSSGGCAFLHPWGYSDTYGSKVAGSGFRKELARAGLDMTSDGKPINIETARERFGFLVSRVEYSLSAQSNRFDAKKEAFVKVVAPLATDLDVGRKPEWDTLLNLMAGEKEGKLKDWLSCATKVNQPIAALYIDATQGSGKGLLVKALCLLWKNGRALPFSNLSKSFQYFSSPLITINEGLDQKASSEILRRIIGDTDMRISQKFEPDGFLEGCVRVIVTANNPDVLNFGKETMTLTDQVATAKRIVAIEGKRVVVDGEETSEASLYLAEMAEKDGLTMEERAKSLAGHIMWLCQNREVKAGRRFLVEGDDKRVVDNIVTGTWNGDRLCEVMAEYVDNPSVFNGDAAALARIHNGELHVTARFLSLSWSNFHEDEKPPSPITVGKTLKSLCSAQLPQERVLVNGKSKPVNFWKVDIAKLENWCRRSDHITVESLRESLAVDTKNAKTRNPALTKIQGGNKGETNGTQML